MCYNKDMTQTANYPKMRIVLSRKYWEDYTYSRCLAGGNLIRTMERLVEIDLTRWEALGMLSDALYYAETKDEQMLSELNGLIRAAKSVAAKLSKSEFPDGPNHAPHIEVEEQIIDQAAKARVALRQVIRSQHKLSHEVDLGRFTYTCGCGIKWTGRDVTAESSAAFDEWHEHRDAIINAG